MLRKADNSLWNVLTVILETFVHSCLIFFLIVNSNTFLYGIIVFFYDDYY